MQTYFNRDSIMFKCSQFVRTHIQTYPNRCSCTSKCFKCVQMHSLHTTISNIYIYIYPNIPKCSSIIHIHFKYTPKPKYTQKYKRKSKYAEIHPDTNTSPSVPNLYLHTPRRQINRPGAAEILTNLDQSVHVKVYYTNTWIKSHNAKWPVLLAIPFDSV